MTEISQHGPLGIKFDFQDGCRVCVPKGRWRIQLKDLDTKSILFDQDVQEGVVQSTKKYFIRFGICVWSEDVLVFSHDLNLEDKNVVIRMNLGGLGDHLAWVGQVAEFARIHKAHVTCIVRQDILSLLDGVYPKINFISSDTENGYYAAYKTLVFFNDKECIYQPVDYRQVGLCITASYILGLSPRERRPEITIEDGGRPISDKYVCIATHASSINKSWNNPRGWIDLIKFIKNKGYRVICIDEKRTYGKGSVSRFIPNGAEDMTGSHPLSERARWLKYAEFFVGVSSGLAWVAWASGTPVVMISGFTEIFNEFYTPYRIINRHVCHGCSNDVSIEFNRSDFFWCPRHANTDREFECSRLIAVEHVTSVIEKIPGFGAHHEK